LQHGRWGCYLSNSENRMLGKFPVRKFGAIRQKGRGLLVVDSLQHSRGDSYLSNSENRVLNNVANLGLLGPKSPKSWLYVIFLEKWRNSLHYWPGMGFFKYPLYWWA
jgi:hypothetical protein